MRLMGMKDEARRGEGQRGEGEMWEGGGRLFSSFLQPLPNQMAERSCRLLSRQFGGACGIANRRRRLETGSRRTSQDIQRKNDSPWPFLT